MDGQNFNNNFNNNNENNYQDNTDSQSVYQNYTDKSETIPPYQDSYQQPGQSDKGENNGLAIVGLVMGIISIVLSCCYGSGVVFGIVGLICSIMANKKNKTGIGTAGLITSIIGIVISVLMLIVYIIVIAYGVTSGMMY
jgi:thiol:disulfide interchange protein